MVEKRTYDERLVKLETSLDYIKEMISGLGSKIDRSLSHGSVVKENAAKIVSIEKKVEKIESKAWWVVSIVLGGVVVLVLKNNIPGFGG